MSARTLLGLTLAILFAAPAFAENWPAWRGPTGMGQSTETKLPTKWSKTDNVRWKIPLPAPGNSTPIVWGNKIFITQATEKGKVRGLYCYDRADGRELWSQTVTFDKEEKSHDTNPQCSASAVTDGERVVAWHGSAGVFCYDLQGKLVWQKDLGIFEHIWGTAASPVIVGDVVVLNCGPGLSSFVVALDKATGDEKWRVSLPEMTSTKIEEFRGSWSTPVVRKVGDSNELLLSLPMNLVALDPKNGQTKWRCEGLSKLVYTSPLFTDKTAVAMSGYHGPALAVKLGGSGDITKDRLWHQTEKIPQRVGSGVIVGDHLYILNENGIAWCLDVASGERLWEKRLEGGNSWSSMVHAAGKIYVLDMQGNTHVLEVNPKECVVLGKNVIGETCRASLAPSEGEFFIRTYNALYCVGEKK